MTTEYVPDNYDAYKWYESEQERLEKLHKRNKQLGLEDYDKNEDEEEE